MNVILEAFQQANQAVDQWVNMTPVFKLLQLYKEYNSWTRVHATLQS